MLRNIVYSVIIISVPWKTKNRLTVFPAPAFPPYDSSAIILVATLMISSLRIGSPSPLIFDTNIQPQREGKPCFLYFEKISSFKLLRTGVDPEPGIRSVCVPTIITLESGALA